MNFESPFDLPVKLYSFLGFFFELRCQLAEILAKKFHLLQFIQHFNFDSSHADFRLSINRKIEVVARRISFSFACFEAFFYAFTYRVWSKKIRFMMDDIMDNLRTGECDEFKGKSVKQENFFIDTATNPRDIAKLMKFSRILMRTVGSMMVLIFCIDIGPTLFGLLNGNRFPFNIRCVLTVQNIEAK